MHRGQWSVSVVGLRHKMSLRMFGFCAVGDEVVTWSTVTPRLTSSSSTSLEGSP